MYDPYANAEEVEHEYGFPLTKKEDLPKADTLIVAVAHDEFKQLTAGELREQMNHDTLLLIDIKHIFDQEEIEEQGVQYWSL